MQVIYKIRKVIDAVIPPVASVLFMVGFIAAFLGAVTRTFTSSSGFVWVDEVTRFAMIWATMLVVGIVMRRNQMTAFTLILEKLPKAVRILFNMAIQILVIVFYGIIFKHGLALANNNAGLSCTTLPFSMKYVYMIWPISAGLLIFEGLTCLIEMVYELTGRPLPAPEQKGEAKS